MFVKLQNSLSVSFDSTIVIVSDSFMAFIRLGVSAHLRRSWKSPCNFFILFLGHFSWLNWRSYQGCHFWHFWRLRQPAFHTTVTPFNGAFLQFTILIYVFYSPCKERHWNISGPAKATQNFGIRSNMCLAAINAMPAATQAGQRGGRAVEQFVLHFRHVQQCHRISAQDLQLQAIM